MNRILNTKINKDIIQIVGNYNLPCLEDIKKNNEINEIMLKNKIDTLYDRLDEQNYYNNGYFHKILPRMNIKIVHTWYISYPYKTKYWTLRKID